MQMRKLSGIRILSAILILVASAAAQQIRFPNFSTLNNLSVNGPAHKASYNEKDVLRLTDGLRSSAKMQASTVWFQVKQPLQFGFTSYFEFQVHNPAVCCNPGDGLAFVIQNSSSTDPTYGATGAGLTALGVANGGVGYAGIPNSIAIEFDTTRDDWDPNSNHVAVQSCGTNTNGPVHIPGEFTIGQNHHVTSCLLDPNGINTNLQALGVICGQTNCQNGAVHQVVVEYVPGNLKVYVDPPFIPGTHTPTNDAVPKIDIPLTIQNVLSVPDNMAWVGFAAGQANQSQTQDILYWEFTPHEDTIVTEEIQPGGEQTTFVYGGHVFGVTYPDGFVNGQHIQMNVNAQTVDRQQFYQSRLAGTPFANETCVTYLETGGKCIVYQVTCQDQDHNPVTCPTEPNPTINIKTSYYTADPVTVDNADFLKAPNNTNNWISIFTGFVQDQFDPTTSGGGKDFSDIVATFKAQSGTGGIGTGPRPIKPIKK